MATVEPLSPPWYREPLVWFLIAIPAASVAAGIVMTVLAARTQDGLVAEDYYKRGLAINRDLARDAAARAGAIRAQLWLEPAGGRVRVHLDGAAGAGNLRVTFVHPTRSGLDRSVMLAPGQAGLHEGASGRLTAGRWHIMLEDEARTWRIGGELRLPQEQSAMLAPGVTDDAGGG